VTAATRWWYFSITCKTQHRAPIMCAASSQKSVVDSEIKTVTARRFLGPADLAETCTQVNLRGRQHKICGCTAIYDGRIVIAVKSARVVME
jgi:hypothetical protein